MFTACFDKVKESKTLDLPRKRWKKRAGIARQCVVGMIVKLD